MASIPEGLASTTEMATLSSTNVAEALLLHAY